VLLRAHERKKEEWWSWSWKPS